MSKLKIIGFIPVYNEADIIEQLITHMTRQGISLIIIDGNSTDGSLEIEQRLIGKGVLEVILQPSQYLSLKDQWNEVFKRLPAYSPDWIIRPDADEFMESPIPNKTLAEAIEEVDRLGCNLIQFNCFEFVLTEKDYNSPEPDIRKRLKYYTWNSDYYFRAWKHYPGIDLITTGGHKPTFPTEINEHVFPAKFILRHYKFRSLEQGMQKVFKDRIPRFDPNDRAKKGWHGHYNNLKPDPSYFIVDSLKCNKYDEDGRWILEKKFDTYFGAWKPPNTDEHLSNDELSKKVDAISKDLQKQFDAIYRSSPIRLYLALKRLLGRL